MMGDTTYNHVFSDATSGDLTPRLAKGEAPGPGDLQAEGRAASGQLLGSFDGVGEDEGPLAPGTVQGKSALDALLGAMMDNMDPKVPAVDAQDTPTGASARVLPCPCAMAFLWNQLARPSNVRRD